MPIYNEKLESYIRKTFTAEDRILSHIRDSTPARGLPAISVRPEEGRLLQFLAATCNAQIALEIGTLGGYSGIWIARGLTPQGRLITVEKNPQHAEVAREHFLLAGVSEQVEIRIGDAHNLLPTLSDEGPFDMIFIDAEKEGYPSYLEWSLANLCPGGVLAAHNVFRHGAIIDSKDKSPSTEAIRSFNHRLATESRLISTIFPAGDGMAIAVMRSYQ
jgi:caffeoyl-CoA O-methyltransferase